MIGCHFLMTTQLLMHASVLSIPQAAHHIVGDAGDQLAVGRGNAVTNPKPMSLDLTHLLTRFNVPPDQAAIVRAGHHLPEYSKHQQKIIKRYYDNRDTIALQRVQEIVTELYLSEGKKQQKHWQSLATHLEKLGVPKVRIDRLLEKNDPKMAGELVQELVKKQ